MQNIPMLIADLVGQAASTVKGYVKAYWLPVLIGFAIGAVVI